MADKSKVMTGNQAFLREVLYLLGDKKRELPLMGLSFVAISLLDLAGIGLVAPYVALVVNPSLVMNSGIYQKFVQWGAPVSSSELLFVLSFVLIVVFSAKAFLGIFINGYILKYSVSHGASLRAYLMHVFQSMPYSIFVNKNSSEYIYQIQELAARFSHTTLQSILRIVSDGFVMFTILILLSWANIGALALLLVTFVGTFWLYEKSFQRKVKEYGQTANVLSTKMIQSVQEGIGGLKEIRILGRENFFYQSVKECAYEYSNANIKAMVIRGLPKYLMEFLMIAFVAVLVLVYLSLNMKTEMLIPTLSMFATAAIRLVPTTNSILSSISLIHFNRDSVHVLYKSIIEYKDLSLPEGQDVFPTRNPAEEDRVDFKVLDLRNVAFRYSNEQQNVLSSINIQINAGEVIGIMGSSGSGKTTLIDIILGLLSPSSGEITIDGKPIAQAKRNWQSQIAYLPQQIFLMDDTLAKNVALGEREDELDLPRIMKSLEQARLSEFVKQLPEGLHTRLGEKGVRLSGGQRQRIALARVFYYNRNVLIMDESTSALDNETETEIVNEIQALKGKKTMIIIAHRLTTLRHCDWVYRLEKGKIAEFGSYKQVVEGVQANANVQ